MNTCKKLRGGGCEGKGLNGWKFCLGCNAFSMARSAVRRGILSLRHLGRHPNQHYGRRVVMNCAMNLTNRRKLTLVALGSVLLAAPVFAHQASEQTKSDQAKPEQAPPSSSAPAPGAATSARASGTSTNTAPAQIVVPAGTHLPLILHNGITSRDAKPGTQLYFETTFPVVVNDRVVIPVGSYAQGEVTEAKRAPKGKGGAEIRIHLTTLILPNGYTVTFDATPTGADTGGGEYTSKEGQINKD